MLEASNFIAAIEKRQGLKVSCIEEIAYKKNFIELTQFRKLIKFYNNSPYSNYLKKLI
jgi:glucose-1-phosphate thymidylyltransferase